MWVSLCKNYKEEMGSARGQMGKKREIGGEEGKNDNLYVIEMTK